MNKKSIQKTISVAMAAAITVGAGTALTAQTANASIKTNATVVNSYSGDVPKYVFMFIGDGMSHAQTQLANYYVDSLNQGANTDILTSKERLSFMDFDVVAMNTTFDSTSFAPDSASTATSLATGEKTYSGTINMNESFTVAYETIAEQVKSQLGYKVGIVSSVTLNHATPAAYYAHNESRNNYYEIGLELIESEFDYFAGGALNKPTGSDGDQESLYDLAEEAGYTVILEDQDAAEKVNDETGKVIIIGEDTNGGALPYENDREDDMWSLADYVDKGIEVLDNDEGFFMMVESGKIDWSCHANDAKSSIADTLAFDEAIEEAYSFYKQHPDETLIIVTGDHETGGLTIGYAGTEYDTFLTLLAYQKGSYEQFEADYVDTYIANKTPFATVLKDIEAYFGLTTNTNASNSNLVLTSYELGKLQTAYNVSVLGTTVSEAEHAINYGGYDPLTVTITHILNNKSGVDFTSYSHTGTTVGTYAHGVGSEMFGGFYDNTDVYHFLADVLNVR